MQPTCQLTFVFRRSAETAILTFALAGCAITEPATNPADLRAASGETGTVYGEVLAPGRDGSRATARTVPGVIVELGVWEGTPYTFRDTLTRDVAATPDDPRFKPLTRVTTDARGTYRIPGAPKLVALALRVRPPSGEPYRITYSPTLFGLANTDSIRISVLLRTP